ncbi:MAG: anion transporter, partial [Acidobacteriia bacterium]|nr:anion transporter [Terriglobia bacterium]
PAPCASTLPVATPPNAIIFSSGWITIPQMVRAGILLDVIGLLIVPMAVYTLGSGVFGF